MTLARLTVLTTLTYEGAHWTRLCQALEVPSSFGSTSPRGPDFEAALGLQRCRDTGEDPDTRFSLPRLRWIHVDHAGSRQGGAPPGFPRGLAITGSAGRSAPVLAEHALFFALSRPTLYWPSLPAQHAREWGVPGQDNLRGLYGLDHGHCRLLPLVPD